jgi:hypothetical protein
MRKLRKVYCPVCKSDLGVHDLNSLFLVDCREADCKIRWCYKPNTDKPIALSYPGMHVPEVCNCGFCAR